MSDSEHTFTLSPMDLEGILEQFRGIGTWTAKTEYQISVAYSEGEKPGPPFKCASIRIVSSYDNHDQSTGPCQVTASDLKSAQLYTQAVRGELRPREKQKEMKLVPYERVFPVEPLQSGKFCSFKFSEPQHFRIENISAVLSDEETTTEGSQFTFVDITFNNESQIKFKTPGGIQFDRIFDWTGKLYVVRPNEEVCLVFYGSVAAKLHLKIAGQMMAEVEG